MKKLPITYAEAILVQAERERIGKELWKWFWSDYDDDFKEVLERLTGVKDPKKRVH